MPTVKERLEEAVDGFPTINEHPQELMRDALDRIQELERTISESLDLTMNGLYSEAVGLLNAMLVEVDDDQEPEVRVQ